MTAPSPLGALLDRYRALTPVADAHRTCPLPPWTIDGDEPRTCDGISHRQRTPEGLLAVFATCPDERARQVAKRLAAERERLGPVLAGLRGEPTFERYDPRRVDKGPEALRAARAFAAGEARGLFLVGKLGLGKTHLLLASHLGHLGRGERSDYTTCAELRALFTDAASYNEERRETAERRLRALWSMDTIHLDELGEGQGDPSGNFYLRLKAAVDGPAARARFAVAACRDLNDLIEHPDVTGTLVDRFLGGALAVLLKGDSQRLSRR